MWLDFPNNIPGYIVVLSFVLGVLLICAQFGVGPSFRYGRGCCWEVNLTLNLDASSPVYFLVVVGDVTVAS